MLTALACLALLASPAAPTVWYGPQKVTFNVQYGGNPYDPASNDVWVRFVNEKGFAIERLAYFDNGQWKAVLVTPQPGTYTPTLMHNKQPSTEEGIPEKLVATRILPHGFIHRDSNYANRLSYDDGTPIFPIGFNLARQDAKLPPIAEQLGKMSAAGLNWTRIWADAWDDKNPWWPQHDPYAIPDQLWAPALDNWGKVAAACEANGVNFQMVLFHHGAFSSKTDPNWQDNPWNAAKGGFLKSASDFFTDPEAIRREKMWLRYTVARFSWSPEIFAWELFNEVEWTDAAREAKWADIAAWHHEMAQYLRSLDPYGHLVTTSSTTAQQALWADMDVMEPHAYADDISAALGALAPSAERPQLVGEFGPALNTGASERLAVRNGVWASILRNEAGTAMYWFWDRVEGQNMYPEFSTWAKAIQSSNLAAHPAAKRADVRSSSGHAEGLRDVDWAMIRISGGTSPVTLRWPGMRDIPLNVHLIDLDTGRVRDITAQASAGSVRIEAPATDCLAWFSASAKASGD